MHMYVCMYRHIDIYTHTYTYVCCIHSLSKNYLYIYIYMYPRPPAGSWEAAASRAGPARRPPPRNSMKACKGPPVQDDNVVIVRYICIYIYIYI